MTTKTKETKRKMATIVANTMTIVGVILLLGTVGASDNNAISFAQVIARLLESSILITLGWLFK